MTSKLVHTLLAVSFVVSLLVTSCAAPAQPTAAPAQPTAAPAQPTAAPAQPTAAPTQPTAAPTQPTAAPAQPTAAPANTAAALPSVYKIGFINHLTGDAAVYGQSALKGVNLAVDQINNAGGIGGVKVQLVVEDDRLDPATAQTAFLKETQSDGVPVVIGPASSGISLSLCKKLAEWNVVDISISSAAAVRDCGPYFFSDFPNDVAQGPEFVRLAQSLNATQVAFMYINNDYGVGVKDEFTKAFAAAGGTLLISEPFEAGGKDFRTEVLKVKQTNPKFVFIVDHTAEGSVVMQQAKQLGLNTQWVLDVSMESPELLKLVGAAGEGAIALRAGSAETPEYKKFTTDFNAKYGEDPTIWSDFSYDQMMLVAKAIEKGGYTVDGIKNALPVVSQTYVGPSGQKAFDKFNVSQGVYDWMIAKNGAWDVYKSATNP